MQFAWLNIEMKITTAAQLQSQFNHLRLVAHKTKIFGSSTGFEHVASMFAPSVYQLLYGYFTIACISAVHIILFYDLNFLVMKNVY